MPPYVLYQTQLKKLNQMDTQPPKTRQEKKGRKEKQVFNQKTARLKAALAERKPAVKPDEKKR
jgi:hypothetical protein